MDDPYKVLGLKRGASEEEAKVAFRTLAKTCHPDLHPDDPQAEQRFKEINQAYDTICKGEQPETIQFRTGDFGESFNYSPFGDIFREIRRRNMDTHLAVVMTLEETFHGKELSISVNNRIVTAQVPRGVMNGMQVHVPGGGNQPNPSAPPGDLYINIRVRQHNVFRRENNNLVATVPVSVFDVLLKKDIEVVNIEGKTLKLALSGSRKLRLTGQGMPDPLNNSLRGDLLIELGVQFPEELTPEQHDLIEKASGI